MIHNPEVNSAALSPDTVYPVRKQACGAKNSHWFLRSGFVFSFVFSFVFTVKNTAHS